MDVTDDTVLCPRCGIRRFRPYGSSRAPQGSGISDFSPPPALSRMDNATYVCSPCGTDEAMREFQGLPPVPPTEWPMRFGFGVGSQTPKALDD